ncbi:MAG: 4'-phosphopantetheinyl transferase superfamily protein [Intestinimonas sp.]|jgi:4'-phosphopantetheinyl transferase|nr:4'-phosphopantetheinyl transferase superfamily protein [Intestinimonas sp.]
MITLLASHSLGTHALLAAVLNQRYGITPLPKLAHHDAGKPFFPAHPEIQFSLSDSGGLALCALGTGPVGADLEVPRPRRTGLERLARYALTEAEYHAFLAQGGNWAAFYPLWTRREAWCKYTGAGLPASRGLDIPGNVVITGLTGDGWYGAVCAEEPADSPILWIEHE